MIVIAAVILATTVLLAMSVLQILVAAGRPYGAFVYGGRHRVLPRGLRVMSAVTVILYIAFGAILVARAGILPGKDALFIRAMTWVLFAFATLSIALNALSQSRPERLTAAPASAVLSMTALVLALAG